VKDLIMGNTARRERDAGRLYESGFKKRMKKRTGNKKCTEFAKKTVNFLLVVKLNYPSVVEDSASTMFDVNREESNLFQQDVNAKKK